MERSNIQISKRLQMIASMVSEGSRLADIGTDHGYVPVYLAKQGKIVSAIAMDVNTGPLKKAEETVKSAGLEKVIELRLSDGLDALQKGEADTVLIAGMGGRLINRILERGKNICGEVSEFILSPHSEIYLVRKYLTENGFEITKEDMIQEEGKYYTVMKAVHGNMEYTQEEYLYGKQLIQKKHKVLKTYLEKEKQKYTNILNQLSGTSEAVKVRKEEVKRRLLTIEKIMDNWKE